MIENLIEALAVPFQAEKIRVSRVELESLLTLSFFVPSELFHKNLS